MSDKEPIIKAWVGSSQGRLHPYWECAGVSESPRYRLASVAAGRMVATGVIPDSIREHVSMNDYHTSGYAREPMETAAQVQKDDLVVLNNRLHELDLRLTALEDRVTEGGVDSHRVATVERKINDLTNTVQGLAETVAKVKRVTSKVGNVWEALRKG